MAVVQDKSFKSVAKLIKAIGKSDESTIASFLLGSENLDTLQKVLQPVNEKLEATKGIL